MPTPPTADPDAILAGLDPEQREVARALTGPVCVLAGAGTGKTRAITHRLAYGVAAGAFQPNQVLALTFTARAAGEMRTRLHQLGVAGLQARTFHAAALRQLQYFWPQAVGGSPPDLASHKAPLVAVAAQRLRINAERSLVRDLAAEIEWAKVNLLTPEQYVARAQSAARGTPGGLALADVARLLQVYEDVKTDRGVIDFEDVLLIVAGFLSEHPQIADSIRNQYRYFVVDEFQDVSALQQAVLTGWLGGRDEVCVVGDPSQTIYSFAGADPRHLTGFTATYPHAVRLKLVRDYRSTPQVVDFANRLLDAAPASARLARVELVAQRAPGPRPEVLAYSDDLAEASGIVARLQALIAAGTPADEIAILYRTNAQSEPIEAALADAGLAYQVRGGERFFARAEVRRAVMLLRGAARAGAGGDTLARDVTAPASSLLGNHVRDVLSSDGWTATAPSVTGAVRDRWESLQALAVLADELASTTPTATLIDFVAELDARAAAAHAPSAGGVTLSSLHAAKGLEWDAVAIIGLNDGMMPITHATTADAVEEERRLLYVGVTRARERLLLSWTHSRTPGGRSGRRRSRFLDNFGGDPGASGDRGASSHRGGQRDRSTGEATSKPTARGSRVTTTLHTTCRLCGKHLTAGGQRTAGRCASCPPDYDERLLEALRQWRTRRAAADRVPPFVIFTDATLEAIAVARPVAERGLLAIAGVGRRKFDKFGADVLALIDAAGRAAN